MNALETKVLELIGESTSSPDVFVDTEEGMAPIRDSLNDAIQEIVMLTGSYRRQYLLPLREDIGFYRLRLKGELGWITDVWSVTNRRRLEQTDLIRLVAHNPRWMVDSADPRAYLPIGNDIVGFWPKPSGNSNVIQLDVVEIPAAYTSDRDRIKLRESFHYAAVHYAVAEFWASRGDAMEAQSHIGRYLDVLGLKQEYDAQREQTRGFKTAKEPWPKATA